MNQTANSTISDNSSILKRSLPFLVISIIVFLRMGYIFFVFFSSSQEEWQEWAESPDTSGYMLLAEDLTDFRIDKPSYRTPGYAFVISSVQRIIHGDQYLGILLLQQLIDGIVAYLLYIIVRNLYKRVAFIPMTLYLLHPYVLSYSVKVLPATLTTLFVMFPFYLLLKEDRITIRRASIIGIFLSIGIIVRPMLMYSSIVLVIYIILTNIKHIRAVVVPIIFLILASTIFPTLIRIYNKTEFGMDSISAQGAFEIAGRIAILTGYCDHSNMFCEGGFQDSIETLSTTNDVVDYQKRDSIYKSISIKLFLHNPSPVIIAHAFGWLGFLRLGNPQLNYLRVGEDFIHSPVNRLIQLYTLICSIIIYPGILLGIFQRKIKQVHNLSILAILLFGYIALIHAKLCGSYYLLPSFGIMLTAGFAGWISYIESKLHVPNSLFAKILKRFFEQSK